MPGSVETRSMAAEPGEGRISPLAGKPAPKEMLLDIARLERDYFERHPDLQDPNQLVSFGTSGHRGSPLHGTFTEAHILAITQAIRDYRREQKTEGPLYMGKDTHALSGPAQRTALEVLAANNVETVIQQRDGVTPTPVISRAILVYNRGRKEHLADGIVITPSHNPPKDGGGRDLREVPVGFKWFVPGPLNGSYCFGGEESAGASFLRRNGTVWTTDKDGPIMNLLAAEITACTGKDPGEHYGELTAEFGAPYYTRIDAPATPEQKTRLQKLSPEAVRESNLAGEPISAKLTRAPGNNASIGGLKVVANSGWFAARPSGTENIYKIYAESFQSQTHLNAIVKEAQEMVNNALGFSGSGPQAGVGR